MSDHPNSAHSNGLTAAGTPAMSTSSTGSASPLRPTYADEIDDLLSNGQRSPILIVDDEPFVADLIYHWVHTVWDFPAIIAHNGEDAIIAMREQHPRLVLLDINLPDINGIDVLRAMRSADDRLPIVMVSAQESVTTAVEALKAGAYDYLTKPIDTERLQVIIRNAINTYGFHQKLRVLQTELNSRYDFSNIISSDPRMHDIFKLMRKACGSEITVCILGESGTGKELVARALHANGPRADRPFQVVNCAAIPHELLESELFGHEKGSFTGAIGRKTGKFEAANGGTLFLDEIGELPPELQPKLLRLLQERAYERVGDTKTRTADVRVIAATNRDLAAAVKAGIFREDLYYRLNVIAITVPPLRERPADLAQLAQIFLQFFAEESGRPVRRFGAPAWAALRAHVWPGNLRELRNAIERAIIMANGEQIELGDLPAEIATTRAAVVELGALIPLDALEQEHVRRVIARSVKLTDAAAVLGIDIATLYRKRKLWAAGAESTAATAAADSG